MRSVLCLSLALVLRAVPTHYQSAPMVSSKEGIAVESQASGPFNVNSYLVYDNRTRQAALIDPGNAVDALLATLDAKALKLKYILLTHCHQDHVVGVPALMARFPGARLCASRQDLSDVEAYKGWRTLFDARSVAAWEKDAKITALMDLDYQGIPKPAVYLADQQELQLGGMKIRALTTPGHSRGSVTFSIANFVFPGDLLLYHLTGYLGYSLCSKEQIVTSVRRLYAAFPDDTIVHSGHGEPSTIGYEKNHNRNVTTQQVSWGVGE